MTDNTQEEKTESTVEAAESTMQSSSWNMAVIIAAIVLVLVAVVGISYWMVYKSSGTNGYEKWVAQTFKLPVAKVNGTKVLLADFNTNVEATEYFFAQQEENQLGLVPPLSGEEIRDAELESLVNEVLLEEIAEDLGVEVTDTDVDEYFDTVVVTQAPGGLDEVTTTLEELYGWEVADFKEAVLRTIVLQTKIQEVLADDEETNTQLLEELTLMRNDIQDGTATFEDIAQQYSEDPGSAVNGGSLGSFGKGVMVAEFEEVAFATAVGEISEPVKTDFGYHIIKVNSRDDEAETVDASHILLTHKSVTSLLEEAQNEAEIKEFVPVYEEPEAEDEDEEDTVESDVVEDETTEEAAQEEEQEESEETQE